jgi:hypothetical protein
MPNDDMAMGPVFPVALEGDRREILNMLPHATAVSLKLPENFSFEEWREIGHKLGRAERTLQWWIADWWVHGEHQYGERIQQVENFGLSFKTCANYGRVARAFRETSRRRELLSFAHHESVAALKPTDADRLLGWCLEEVVEGKRDPRRVWELRNRIALDRIKTMEDAATDEKVAAVLAKTVVTKNVHPPFTVTVYHSAPKAPVRIIPCLTTLDESGAGGLIPEELAAPTLEPPPSIDRVALAMAAFRRLEGNDVITVFRDCFNELTQPEQNAIRQAIRDGGAAGGGG